MRNTQRNTLTFGSAIGGNGSSIGGNLGNVSTISEQSNPVSIRWMLAFSTWFQPYSPGKVAATPSPRKDANSAPVRKGRTWDTDSHWKGLPFGNRRCSHKSGNRRQQTSARISGAPRRHRVYC